MKKNLLLLRIGIFSIVIFSCNRHAYTASNFEEKTEDHKVVAILPAEMIFTGKQPKNITEDQIAKTEEDESIAFQYALYNSILRHANTSKYITTVNFQDINETQKLLNEKSVSIRDSWKMSDRELATLLGVDAVIKMRIQKRRYMSDEASYGVTVAKQIVFNTKLGSKVPAPYVPAKTNDIYASCNLISDGQTLWNDNYKAASDYDSPANIIIENITDNFGNNFPYKKRRR